MRRALIVGLGNFGISLVRELVNGGSEVVVIEEDQERAQQIKDIVSEVIVGDATSKELLKKFGSDVDFAVVCLGDKIDSSILVTYYLKDIGIKKIVAKANSEDHGKILKIVGAHEVVFPERDTAKRLATSITSPDVLDFIKVSDDFDIVEVAVPDEFVNKTIRGMQLRSKHGVDILAIKNPMTGETKIMPSPDYAFKPDDVMVVIGETGSIRKITK